MEQKSHRLFSAAILLLVVILAGIVVYYVNRIRNAGPKSVANQPAVVGTRPETALPAAIAQLGIVNGSTTAIYNIQTRVLADGGRQYVASYDTNDLKAEYDHAKQALSSNKQFFLVTDSQQTGAFVLAWSRSVEQLQVTGVGSSGPGGTVVISYYKRL